MVSSNSLEDHLQTGGMADRVLTAPDIGKAILDTIGALVVVIDTRGQIVLFNHACEQATGYSNEEVRGKVFWDLLLMPEEIEPVREVFDNLVAGKFPNQHENYWIGRDGSRRLIAWSNTALVNAAGEVEFVIGTGIDVTEARKAEQAQRENEQLYSSLFRNNHAVMLLIDPETGQIVDANPAACSFYGYPPEALTAMKITDINTLSEQEVFQEMEQARTEARNSFIFRHRLANGEIREVEVYSGPICFGGRSLLYSIVHDITERVQAEAQRDLHLNRLNTIINAMAEAVAIYDVQGNCVQVNPAAEAMFGFNPAGQERAETFMQIDIRHPDGRPVQEEELPSSRALLGSPVQKAYLLFTNIYREKFHVLASSAPLVSNGELIGAVVVWHDISELKQVEEALKVHMRQLERTNQELHNFAFIASHDLQEPLRKIQLFADRLRSRYQLSLDEAGQEYLERMQSGANRLQRMIQDLLAYSRVSTQVRPFTLTDLTQVAREVVSDLEVRIELSGGKVTVEELPVVEADPLQIRQLFQNLIGNALKFRRPGVAPDVRLRTGASTQSAVEILVEDNGVGFEEQYLERLFQPFQRLHSPQIFEGTGIGLAISQKIVERHSGSITAQSIPGQGTTFIVTLPRRQDYPFNDHSWRENV